MVTDTGTVILGSRTTATLLWRISRFAGLGPVALRLHPKSAMVQSGRWGSFRRESPISRNGQPIPWWTYSAIDFLESRLDKSLRVVEFGCGHSTAWLARFAAEVVSLENNLRWIAKVRAQLPGNARIVPVDTFNDSSSLPSFSARFHVAVVDSDGDRHACASFAVENYLAEDGVVVWDNTNRPDSGRTASLMRDYGFREIFFSGMCPQVINVSRTSIFYRDRNCLGI